MKNKLISSALALGMLATMAVPAFAEEQSSEITVNLQPTVMSVKVPTQLPIGVNADGSSSGAVTAHIQNNGAAQVEVTDVRVVKGVSEELDAEAVRIVSASPKWKPGRVNGNKVRSSLTIPVEFKLEKKGSRSSFGIKKY